MKNYNKRLCVLVLVMLLGVGSGVFAHENITADDSANGEVIQDKVKANRDTLSKAQSAIDNKDFASAINYLNGYIASKQGNYEAYKLRGDAYYALRRYNLAQNDYQTAVNIKSGEDKLSTGTKYVGAIILGADKNEQLQNVELGNLYAALMYAQKALNNPAYTSSYDNAVKYNSHIYLPQPNKSDINKINCPQKYAKKLNPTGIDATIASAISDIEKSDYHASIFKIQNVINEYPNYYLGYYLMGVALVGVEKDDEAIKSFEKALQLNPYDFESMASLGQIYFDRAETNFSKEDAQKSMDYFLKALESNGNCPTYYFYLGLNNLNTGNIGSATRNFDKALRINENDYNSRYYKAIAQYMNGDYNSVVTETSKLLYKHVSNYNSVLYLRALAYNKLGQKDKALADLNSLDENITDVFNTDIKVISEKDKVLVNYANYLRSQIGSGENLSSKTNNGTSNPIIKKLSGVQNYLKPYENIINSSNITEEDYKKLENFYSVSLPKLLETGMLVSYNDIDTQYDFIRTTFSDLGVTFVPKSNNTYAFTSIKDYYKKYSPKLSAQNTLAPQQFFGADIIPVQMLSGPADAQSTPTDKMLQAGESSLAQMLASNVLLKVTEERAKSNIQTGIAPQNVSVMSTSGISSVEIKPANPETEKTKPVPIVASQEPYVPSNKQLVTDSNMQKMKSIIAEEESIGNANNSMVFSAKEIKPANEFKIYNEPVNKAVDTVKSQSNIETTEGGNVKISAKEIKDSSGFVVRNVPVADTSKIDEKIADASSKVVQTTDNAVSQVQTTVQKTAETTQNTVKAVQSNVQKSSDSVVQSAVKTLPKQTDKVQNNNPYVKQVYQGLSSAMAEAQIGNPNDVVELNVPKDSSTFKTSAVLADRLGFGAGSNAENSIFASKTNPVQDKFSQLSTEASEALTTADKNVSDAVKTVKEVKKETQAIPSETVKAVSKEITPEVVVPDIASDKSPQIRELVKETPVSPEEVSASAPQTVKDEKSGVSLLEEYERLLKEKEKIEKIQKKEEAKAEKLRAKEEKENLIRAEKKEKQLIKEEEQLIKAEEKLAKAEENAKAALEKEKAKGAAIAAKQEAKARKAEAKAEEKLAKQQQKAQASATERKEGFVSKLKDKFKKAEKTPQEKAAELQQKAEKKAQAAQLKEERAKAKLEAKERRAKAKAEEKLAKQQQKAQASATEQKEGFVSKLKDKFKKAEKTPQEKAAELQEKAEKKAQAQRLKEEKAKIKAEQKTKKAQEKSVEKARKSLEKSVNNSKKSAEKTNSGSFLDKLKFWKKKESPSKNSSVSRYINNAIKPKQKPALRF